MELFLFILSLVLLSISGFFFKKEMNEDEDNVEFMKNETNAPITDDDYKFRISFR